MHRKRKSYCNPCRFYYLSLGNVTKWRQPCQSCQIRTKTRSALTEVMGQNQRQLQETVPCKKQKESTKEEEQVTRRMSLNTRAHLSVSRSASDRQRNENFLWCCKQIVSSQKSVLKSQCASQKHTRSKEKITISKLKEQSIAELIISNSWGTNSHNMNVVTTPTSTPHSNRMLFSNGLPSCGFSTEKALHVPLKY